MKLFKFDVMKHEMHSVTPLSKTRAALFAKYKLRKHRERNGIFVAEGRKTIGDLLPTASPSSLVKAGDALLPEEWVPYLVGTEIFEATESQMSKITTLSTAPDYYAVFPLPLRKEYDGKGLEPDLYLMLDGVQDPGNLGTIVRTAHWFGIKTIFASRDTVDIFNPKTIMATMGSLGHADVIYCNLREVVTANPEFPVYGLLLDGEDIYKADLGKAGFIVMGNEGNGISASMRNAVTSPLLIPPGNKKDHGESLNVAIATAVTLSQFRSRL